MDEKPQAIQIARFLRHCPGLSKQTIGDLLGEHDDFFLEVLEEFTKTFDFQGSDFSWLLLMAVLPELPFSRSHP